MSSLGYRDWDIWVNKSFFDSAWKYDGYYECAVLPSLMVQQTIEFLIENFELRENRFIPVQRPPIEIVRREMISKKGQLCIKIYGVLDTSLSPIEMVHSICNEIDAISLCVDSPLICNEMTFYSHFYGPLFMTNRRPISRGVSFEVEERFLARDKIIKDFNYYFENCDQHFIVGKRHYLTGLMLLGLEDQVAGLIDAAFMQFYQGCEALCKDPKGRLEESKKFIALQNLTNSKQLQIIAHQVWRVRNKYFGHGDVSYNLHANSNLINATQVAKQVLVARYLCRQLLDMASPSGNLLCREMGFYSNEYSGDFSGDINQLGNEFRVDYEPRVVDIYNMSGEKIEKYIVI